MSKTPKWKIKQDTVHGNGTKEKPYHAVNQLALIAFVMQKMVDSKNVYGRPVYVSLDQSNVISLALMPGMYIGMVVEKGDEEKVTERYEWLCDKVYS